MRKSVRWLWAALSLLALSSFSPAVQAQTVVDVQVGETFSGDIAVAGVDTVEARFPVAAGRVKITVRSVRGSTLQPTVVVRDPSGAALAGSDQRIRWLPVGNVTQYVTIPADGTYTAEIGGTSGSGAFWVTITGTPYTPPELFSLSGTVTDSLTGAAIDGASVYVGGTLSATTDANGAYAFDLAAGNYSVTVSAGGFQARTQPVSLAGAPVVLDFGLLPVVPVIIEASVSGDTEPGDAPVATVDIQMPPGSILNSITWTQEYGVPASIANADTDTATVTLGSEADYRDELIHVLHEPPVTQDQLPPNVPLPPGEFPAGLQDRFQVVAINPLAAEEAALVVLKVEVDTEYGVVTDEIEIHTHLPWPWSTGLRNVPVGASVLLHGKDQAAYDWMLSPPVGSAATLMEATSQNPYFTPDIDGVYVLEVTDEAAAGTIELELFAGEWRGMIVDQDINNRPVPDTACTECHDDVDAPDVFTPWKETGHAEIFTDNLNTSTHYGTSCFPCHSVGFNTEVANEGFDDATDYADFIGAGLLNNPGDNWTTVLSDYPETALRANIQCENCHGPQDSVAHGYAAPLGEPRVSLSADVCASCHGEPLRHGRFQQWQLSAHANYELAIDEGDSGSCSRCHTANGFLEWVEILLDDDPNTDPLDDIFYCDDDVTNTCVGGARAGQACGDDDDCPPEWTTDGTHPQTCVTCHDPHMIGTTSGNNTNATVRISDDTPPLIAGFQATDVGRGAICMTCHNSRRGLRNDTVWPNLVGTSESVRAPHGSAQTDVLMGQNAYLIPVGTPGGHGMLEETCIDCHMEATPPPDVLSYNQGGTNHTFYASTEICADCHSPRLLASDVQDNVQFLLDQVQDLIEDGWLQVMDDVIATGYTVDLDGDATVVDVNDIAEIEFGETRGRQAVTVTFVGGAQLGPYRLTDVDVRDAGNAVVDQLYGFADEALIKSGWNWNLVNNDGSLGVHNPLFVADALSAARNALVTALTGRSPARGMSPSQRIGETEQGIRDRYRRTILRDLQP